MDEGYSKRGDGRLRLRAVVGWRINWRIIDKGGWGSNGFQKMIRKSLEGAVKLQEPLYNNFLPCPILRDR